MLVLGGAPRTIHPPHGRQEGSSAVFHFSLCSRASPSLKLPASLPGSALPLFYLLFLHQRSHGYLQHELGSRGLDAVTTTRALPRTLPASGGSAKVIAPAVRGNGPRRGAGGRSSEAR